MKTTTKAPSLAWNIVSFLVWKSPALAMVLAASMFRIYNKHYATSATTFAVGRQPLAVLDESCSTYFDSHGGIALYLLGVVFCLIAIATICEEDFKNSIICLARGLRMPPDIAGATLMAAGTSSPELFASLVALGATSDDVGSGTIVGSVVFNTMIIIGGSALASKSGLFELSPSVVLRDSFWNTVAVIFLLVSFWDERIIWYEALVAVLLYALYVVHMAYQRPFHAWLAALYQRCTSRCRRTTTLRAVDLEQRDEDDFHAGADADDYDTSPGRSSSAGIRNLQRPISPEPSGGYTTTEMRSLDGGDDDHTRAVDDDSNNNDDNNVDEQYDEVHPIKHPFALRPHGLLHWIEAVLFFPWKLVFYYTIPNPQSERFRHMYFVSFTACLLWLAFLTYMMIGWATKLGCLLHIDDAIMGATVLAIGTSMPDCLTSIAVAKDGQGDMAVSNALGSNIFDILVALGLPWLLDAAITAGKPVIVESSTIGIDSAMCFACLAIFLVSLRINKWRLNKFLGVMYCIIYAFFLAYLIGYPLYIARHN